MTERLRKSSILVVDDSPANLRILVEALQDDYHVRVAAGGRDALEAVAEDLPDLILLDVVMPDIDGYEVCRRLKAHPATSGIPVIFVTGRDHENDELDGLAVGAVDYIAKPFSLPIARARIRTHLDLKRYRDLLENQSYIDGLTGIPNRRRFNEALRQTWASAQRRAESLALLMIDVDHFKDYNDHYGHQAGDDCLIAIARALTGSQRRPLDLVARYGGEEFVALLPHTDLAGAVAVGESIAADVAALRLPHARSPVAPNITLSIGVAATLPNENEPPGPTLDAADQALYRAKRAGRNRVSC